MDNSCTATVATRKAGSPSDHRHPAAQGSACGHLGVGRAAAGWAERVRTRGRGRDEPVHKVPRPLAVRDRQTSLGACHCERVSLLETLSSISPNDAAALARLLGQLSTTTTFDSGRLHAIIDHEATELLVARVGGQIVGMATYVSFPLPTGLRGHVEDVVVDESMRGRGIARKLLETMTTMAGERGLRTLDLTSRPSRESALRLYEGVGFRRRETNILRFTP
jgi:GNAT superfamily N-acetyltransferase